jgi:hypothetical protein
LDFGLKTKESGSDFCLSLRATEQKSEPLLQVPIQNPKSKIQNPKSPCVGLLTRARQNSVAGCGERFVFE